jgi:hypothetical protein
MGTAQIELQHFCTKRGEESLLRSKDAAKKLLGEVCRNNRLGTDEPA